MKNSLLLAGFATILAVGTASAQSTVDIDNVPCHTTYYTLPQNNWFIEVGGGISATFVENPESRHHQITANYGVGFGKWFSPYFAWRLEGQGGAKHWNITNGQMGHFKAASANIDIMWDMFNSLGGVNSERVFSIIPFIGVGATYAWDYTPTDMINIESHGHAKKNNWLFPASAGIQFRFRLSQYVDFFAQARATFYGDSYNDFVIGRPVDIDLSCLGGFSFNIGGRDFRSFNPCNYTDYIRSLNEQVNNLRGELATTAAALAAAEAQLPCPEVTEQAVVIEQAPLLATVRFRINSARISNEEKVNVYNVAEYLKANPDQNLIITGYADRDTGTSSYNMALSQRRAQAVYDMLTKEYGIDPSRLAMAADGSDVQPYDVNNWNRIVIFSNPE